MITKKCSLDLWRRFWSVCHGPHTFKRAMTMPRYKCSLYFSSLLYAAVTHNCTEFWLAGNRVEPSSLSPFIWRLTAGCGCEATSAIRYSSWAPGQPDNAGDTTSVRESCLVMTNISSQWPRSWHDVDCSLRTCAICEYRHVTISN